MLSKTRQAPQNPCVCYQKWAGQERVVVVDVRAPHGMNDDCVVVATRQVSALANLFDCLRHVATEVTLRFNNKGMRIAELAGTNTLFIYTDLDAYRFEQFALKACAVPSFFVVSTATLHTVLNVVTRRIRDDVHSMLRLCFSGSNTFHMALIDDQGHETVAYELPCRHVPNPTAAEEDAQAARLFEEQGYSRTMYMSQRHLSHLVSHVFPLGQTIEVSCTNDSVHFSVCNPHALISKARVSFLSNTRECDQNKPPKKAIDKFTFHQPLLSMLVRAMSLHATTAVVLPEPGSNDRPVLMRASVGDLGQLSVAIAQIHEHEEERMEVDEVLY